MLEMKEWDGFEGRLWKEEINVRQFIQDNYTPYDGNEDFLAGPTEATALGNISVQMIAAGEFADLKETRKCIFDSFEIKLYEA